MMCRKVMDMMCREVMDQERRGQEALSRGAPCALRLSREGHGPVHPSARIDSST